MYDIIGDIHGHADELVELLDRMGYQHRGASFSHPNRIAVFVGDFIDRGPKIAQVLQIVRPMIDSGSAHAVMGNHEFNAIAYHTRDPANKQRFLREHTSKNEHQHRETMRQLSADQLSEAIHWFRSLPMWLELDGFRVVHACWDTNSMDVIEKALTKYGGVNTEFMQSATQEQSSLYKAVEDVLKGKELSLSDGLSFKDKDGHERREIRIKWYEHPAGKTYKQYALPTIDQVPDTLVDHSVMENVNPYLDAEPPVFFGHYWLKAKKPARLAPNVVCVDYSVAKGGSLCAYRWDGEAEFQDDKFVWVEAHKSLQ